MSPSSLPAGASNHGKTDESTNGATWPAPLTLKYEPPENPTAPTPPAEDADEDTMNKYQEALAVYEAKKATYNQYQAFWNQYKDYVFAGWTTSDGTLVCSTTTNGSGQIVLDPRVDFPATYPADGAVYKAKWRNGATYTIDLFTNTSEVSDMQVFVEHGSSIPEGDRVLPDADSGMKKAGYTFEGWFTSDTFDPDTEVSKNTEGKYELSDAAIEQDYAYYAKWTANDSNIHFNANGGKVDGQDSIAWTGKTDEAVMNDDRTALPGTEGSDVAVKRWLTFLGWATSATAKTPDVTTSNIGTNGKFTTQGETGVTYYAVYSANDSTIVFDANSGLGGQADPDLERQDRPDPVRRRILPDACNPAAFRLHVRRLVRRQRGGRLGQRRDAGKHRRIPGRFRHLHGQVDRQDGEHRLELQLHRRPDLHLEGHR